MTADPQGAVVLTHEEREILRPVIARYARFFGAPTGPVFEAVERIVADRTATLAADLAEARRVIEAVRAVHSAESTDAGPDFCRTCSESAREWIVWPCKVAALLPPAAEETNTHVAAPYPAGHGWTPSMSPFSNGEACRVMLARYPCNFTREEHDPALPPVDVDVFGYRRGRFTQPVAEEGR